MGPVSIDPCGYVTFKAPSARQNRNGYDPNGATRYSAKFQTRYLAAQSARMNRLIDYALDVRHRVEQGDYPYSDNDILLAPRAGGPRLFEIGEELL